MNLIRAEHLGFCSGVQRAVELAEEALHRHGAVYADGPLVHNHDVIAHLEAQGMCRVARLDEVPDGGAFIVRAHGISKSEWQELEAQSRSRGVIIIDATCPSVQRIFHLAEENAAQKKRVVIVGEHGHPEVEAARSWAGEAGFVVADLAECKALDRNLDRSLAVLAQSTLEQSLFSAILDDLRRDFPNHVVFNTICSATRLRQEAAVALAQQVDRMIVIGGRHSANTRHLYDLCLRLNPDTVLIESGRDLAVDWLTGAEVIGITAGASTPEWIIEEVETTLMDWEKNLEAPEENSEEQEEEQVTEQATEAVTEVSDSEETAEAVADENTEPVPQEAPEAAPTEENSDESSDESSDGTVAAPDALEEALEMGAFDLPRHSVGDVIKATVVNIRSDEVLVDVGLKSEGVIPRRELSFDSSLTPEEIVSVGEEIEVQVLRSEDQEGRITFSKRRADQLKHWDSVIESFDKGEIIEGKVGEVIKGGLLVDIGVRGFMPASQAERRFTSDLRHLVGQTVRVKLLEVDRDKQRAIVSRKAVLDQEADVAKEAFWGRVSEGDIVKGVVRRLTDFGAFVDLGGVDGLLHISDMAYHRVNKPSDIVAIDQEIELKILKLNPETSKVSLGLKQLQPRPWEALSQEIQPNDIISGVVVRTTAWGAFVNVRPGIDGLIHISELDNQRVAKVEDVINIGDEVQVMVLSINPDQERLSLSLKAVKNLQPQDDVYEEEGYYGEEDGYGHSPSDAVYQAEMAEEMIGVDELEAAEAEAAPEEAVEAEVAEAVETVESEEEPEQEEPGC